MNSKWLVVDMYWLENKHGMCIGVSEWGAAWLSCQVPMHGGVRREVLLGTDDPERMSRGRCYIGSSVGRYCGRIAGAHFLLDGKAYQVDANERGNHLHGGHQGLSQKRWAVSKQAPQELTLVTQSSDGEGGFPGNINIYASFTLTDEHTVIIQYQADTDQATILNLCNHAYFNLNGVDQSALTQRLQVNAEHYMPVDDNGIPTQDACKVAGTAYDFRRLREITNGIYDHSFWLEDGQHLAAVLESAHGDVQLSIRTTQPALHIYTGQGLISERDRTGQFYPACAGVALETQAPPDSANRHLDLVKLMPNQNYRHNTHYHFVMP